MKSKISDLITIMIAFLNDFKFCIKLSWKASKLYTIIRIISRILQSIISMVLIYMSKTVFDFLTSGSQNPNRKFDLVIYLVIILLLHLVVIVINNVSGYCMGIHNDILSNYINMTVMDKALYIDISNFDSPKYNDKFEAIQRDSYSMINIVWNAIDGIGSLITAFSSFFILCNYNIFFGIIIVAASIPSSITNLKYTKSVYKWSLDYIHQERKMGYLRFISTNKDYAMDVRMYHIGEFLKNKYQAIWNTFFSTRSKIIKKRSIIFTLCSFIPEICIIVILIHITFHIIDGYNTIGDYSLYSGMLAQLSMSIYLLISVINNIYEDRLKINTVQEFEKIPVQVKNNGTHTLDDDIEIEFQGVFFHYPETEHMVLKNISFKVNKLEKVCIVGLNGAGKSTIIKLILRFYDVTEGCILINGIDIRQYDINKLRKKFSSYFQNSLRYSFSLRENIILSDLRKYTGDDDAIIELLKKSEASDVLSTVKNGLDGYISKSFEEDGIELSGGQNQKIALVRTFFRRCSVLILDEPASYLDPEAEYNLFEYLREICKYKTTVFTSHRLSNVSLADRIIVIENGSIIEQGTHNELMNNPKRYATLYKYQADKYQLKGL